MPKLKLEDLAEVRRRARKAIWLRDTAARVTLTVHMGPCGIAAGARDIVLAALREVEEAGFCDVLVSVSDCAGLCAREPMATVEVAGQPPVRYVNLTEAKVKEIFAEHILAGKIVERYALKEAAEKTD